MRAVTLQERLETAAKAEAEARSRLRRADQANLAAVAEWNDAGKRMEEARAAAFAAEVEYERVYHARKAAQQAVDLGEEDRKP